MIKHELCFLLVALHAVLSGSQALDRPKATGASGSAIISVDDKGNIKYKVSTPFIAINLKLQTFIIVCLCQKATYCVLIKNVFAYFQILLTGLRTNVVGLTIEGDPKNRRKRRIVADILKDYRNGKVRSEIPQTIFIKEKTSNTHKSNSQQ